MGNQRLCVIVILAFATNFGSLAFGAVDIAKINSRSITDQDIRNALGELNEAQRKNVLSDPTTRRQILTGVIDQEVLVQEAEKQKLDQDQEFKVAMEGFKKQFLAGHLLRKNLSAKITDREVKRFYETHKLLFSTDRVHAFHILTKTEREARDLLKKAKEPRADFQAMAETHSVDPSAKNNRGDLGFFTRDRMAPEFAEAAFGAPMNQVIGPVKTAYGYHLIKVVEKKAGQLVEFSDAEPRAREALRQELTRDFIDQLKNKSKIEIDFQALDRI